MFGMVIGSASNAYAESELCRAANSGAFDHNVAAGMASTTITQSRPALPGEIYLFVISGLIANSLAEINGVSIFNGHTAALQRTYQIAVGVVALVNITTDIIAAAGGGAQLKVTCTPAPDAGGNGNDNAQDNSTENTPANVASQVAGATTVLDGSLSTGGAAIENNRVNQQQAVEFKRQAADRLRQLVNALETTAAAALFGSGFGMSGDLLRDVGAARSVLIAAGDEKGGKALEEGFGFLFALGQFASPDYRISSDDLDEIEALNETLRHFNVEPLRVPGTGSSAGAGSPASQYFPDQPGNAGLRQQPTGYQKVNFYRSTQAFNLMLGSRPISARFYTQGKFTHFFNDMNGHGIDGRVGISARLGDDTSAGLFLSGNGGEVRISTTNFKLSRTGIGLGAFAVHALRPNLHVSGNAEYYRFDNDVTSNGATGGFDSSLFLFKGGVSVSRRLGGKFVLATEVSAGLSHRNLDGYTLSDGTVVGSGSSTGFLSSLTSRLSRTYVTDWYFGTVTPFAILGLHYNSLAEDVIVSGARTVNLSRLTGTVGGGVGMATEGGRKLDASVTVGGIGGDVQSVTGFIKFSTPLH